MARRSLLETFEVCDFLRTLGTCHLLGKPALDAHRSCDWPDRWDRYLPARYWAEMRCIYGEASPRLTESRLALRYRTKRTLDDIA
jgi:hypothetical protein